MNKTIALLLFTFASITAIGQSPKHDLRFNKLASQWDEAIPLGNGTLGALIWQKGERLRFSLDRVDVWDMRPMKGLHRKEFSYQWVIDQVNKKDYAPVQQYFDAPYDNEPAPSKIPGGALEFETKDWGKAQDVHLSIKDAVCEVKWANGVILKTFVDAVKPLGWFRFENVSGDFKPHLIAPRYQGEVKVSGDPVGGDDLSRLGYKQGMIKQNGNSITYHQEGWGGFTYDINVRWKRVDSKTVEGVWSISSQYPSKPVNKKAAVVTQDAISANFNKDLTAHTKWWGNFWSKSAIHVPDTLIEKQWYLEQYKFGSVARADAPPISLQAVWTADNGRIPPWKGDYHHDLNTQLSYWPSYSGNHLDEAMGYINHMEENKANYKRYTKLYFGTDGIAVPGVTTLDGTEMGGWIQYSLSPTVSSWLGQHYYLQWRYSMDRTFLKNKTYPWIKGAAIFLENITVKDANGYRKLKISSSPEINDNDLSAWFSENTNYDLALMKFTFKAAAELATELGLKTEAAKWTKLLNEFDDFSITDNDELKFAPSLNYKESHRHFSHMMAIHPLGLIKWEDGAKAQSIIKNTIQLLDKIGPDYWCGYSYSWLANMKARAKDGEGAAKDLQIFAKAFCSINSFHLNGDQTKTGLSKFQYRPFTLEGNFAFAAGLQEMLLQSYAGFIEIMPAIPAEWKDASFENLRTEGAFLVSAKKAGGQVDEVKIVSEKGGVTKLKLPFKTHFIVSNKDFKVKSDGNGFLELTAKPGAVLVLKNGYE
ncbi:glycosyl hydrolase family 95 catalytic domain-containing protein [Pedobacter foliorum]|uniref:glycosyl hydrolase family 95 catalytic domain-containing protein n=1 Tax=Pedobacter foliorum TaxID=2739058 RepID=UPI001563C039|nr:glycoside hydrolase N-terminal domain-containing protein [Pedobacter foliorum]NRF38000.1 glycoside hydrolase N-terminal domain-containing protein [Pedobacter foliorum]